MKDDKLIDFLEKYIAQFKALEALADAVMAVKDINSLGNTYRTLIERLDEAWKESNRIDRNNEKVMKKNPALRKDSRVAWLNSVHMALLKAHAHKRPAVNSRQLQAIHDAAYVINTDLSLCRYDLERELEQQQAQT
jgi:hypothetical protein